MFMQKEWCAIKLIDYFFILLIINSFVFFYSIYTFFEMKIFHNKQGSKLNIKKHSMNRWWFYGKTHSIYIRFYGFSLLYWLYYFFPFIHFRTHYHSLRTKSLWYLYWTTSPLAILPILVYLHLFIYFLFYYKLYFSFIMQTFY